MATDMLIAFVWLFIGLPLLALLLLSWFRGAALSAMILTLVLGSVGFVVGNVIADNSHCCSDYTALASVVGAAAGIGLAWLPTAARR